MSGFRLARLLKLREDQADAAKQRWAVAQRAVVEASAALEAAHARLHAGRVSLAAAMDGRHEEGSIGRILGAHQALDSLEAAIAAHRQELDRARELADERRREHEEAARSVKALSRLEDRWERERTARRRRADARIQDEFVARLARGRSANDPNNEGPVRASTNTSEPRQQAHTR